MLDYVSKVRNRGKKKMEKKRGKGKRGRMMVKGEELSELKGQPHSSERILGKGKRYNIDPISGTLHSHQLSCLSLSHFSFSIER